MGLNVKIDIIDLIIIPTIICYLAEISYRLITIRNKFHSR